MSAHRAENLPDPETLWAFAAAGAAVAAGMGSFWPEGRRIAEDGSLFMEDGGGNWFRLVRVEGGRFLLVGWDRDGSTTSPHEKPTHLFADAPAWLPWAWIERAEERGVLGFAYWWDGKAWARSEYPEGVRDGVPHHTDPRRDAASATMLLADLLEGHVEEIPEWADPSQEELDAFRARIGEFAAAVGERSVTEADLGFLADVPFDTAAAIAVLERAGVAAGSSLGVEPVAAGTEVPAQRQRVRKLSDQEWGEMVEAPMRASRELERSAPPDSEPLQEITDFLRGLAAERGGAVTLTVSVTGRSYSQRLVAADGSWIDDVRVPDVFALYKAEAHPEHGNWFFLRVRATPDAVEVDRAYDHWPAWFEERFGFSPGVPIDVVAAEMASRAPHWRPDWVWLLDEEVAYDPPADLYPPPPATATPAKHSEVPASEEPPQKSGWWRRRRNRSPGGAAPERSS